jgi:hypothetical protein
VFLNFFFLIVELVYKKKGLILKILIVAVKKKINILVFGRELGKENWSLGIYVALYFYFFQILSLFNLIFSLDSKSL